MKNERKQKKYAIFYGMNGVYELPNCERQKVLLPFLLTHIVQIPVFCVRSGTTLTYFSGEMQL